MNGSNLSIFVKYISFFNIINNYFILVSRSGEEVNWVQCDGCQQWFHLLCVGLAEDEVSENEDYICFQCREKKSGNGEKLIGGVLSPAALSSLSKLPLAVPTVVQDAAEPTQQPVAQSPQSFKQTPSMGSVEAEPSKMDTDSPRQVDESSSGDDDDDDDGEDDVELVGDDDDDDDDNSDDEMVDDEDEDDEIEVDALMQNDVRIADEGGAKTSPAITEDVPTDGADMVNTAEIVQDEKVMSEEQTKPTQVEGIAAKFVVEGQNDSPQSCGMEENIPNMDEAVGEESTKEVNPQDPVGEPEPGKESCGENTSQNSE